MEGSALGTLLEMVLMLISNALGTLLDLFLLFSKLLGQLGLVMEAGGIGGLVLSGVIIGIVLFFLLKFLWGSWKTIVVLIAVALLLIIVAFLSLAL